MRVGMGLSRPSLTRLHHFHTWSHSSLLESHRTSRSYNSYMLVLSSVLVGMLLVLRLGMLVLVMLMLLWASSRWLRTTTWMLTVMFHWMTAGSSWLREDLSNTFASFTLPSASNELRLLSAILLKLRASPLDLQRRLLVFCVVEGGREGRSADRGLCCEFYSLYSQSLYCTLLYSNCTKCQ